MENIDKLLIDLENELFPKRFDDQQIHNLQTNVNNSVKNIVDKFNNGLENAQQHQNDSNQYNQNRNVAQRSYQEYLQNTRQNQMHQEVISQGSTSQYQAQQGLNDFENSNYQTPNQNTKCTYEEFKFPDAKELQIPSNHIQQRQILNNHIAEDELYRKADEDIQLKANFDQSMNQTSRQNNNQFLFSQPPNNNLQTFEYIQNMIENLNKNEQYQIYFHLRRKFETYSSQEQPITQIPSNKYKPMQNSKQHKNQDQGAAVRSLQYDATLYNFFKNEKYPETFGYTENYVEYSLPNNVTKKLSEPIVNLIGMMFDENEIKQVLQKNNVNINKLKRFPSRQDIIDTLDSLKKVRDNKGKFHSKIPFFNKPNTSSSKDVSVLEKGLNEMLLISDTHAIIKEFQQDPNFFYRYYEKLNTKIRVLEKDCEEYKNILKYLNNSHGPTHKDYTLEVKEIFKLSRRGEFKSYKVIQDKLKFSKLLWFGTETIIYPSILCNGFQLRPSQSPNHDLIFGNGIYFTDTVSKAANKCKADKNNPEGLLLLAEVCLGETCKKTKIGKISYSQKKNGSVKGLGKYAPNKNDHFYTHLGVQVPLGKLVLDSKLQSDLNYNEYVVYNPNQILLQYLVKVKFHFK